MFKAIKKVSVGAVDLVMTVRGGDEYIQRRIGKTLLSTRERRQMAEAGQQASEHGLSPIAGAEISCRVDHHRLVINTAGAALPALNDNTIVFAALDKKPDVPGAAPLLPWHHALYNHVQEAGAVLFCQPMYTMLATGAGVLIDDTWMVDITEKIGGVTQVSESDLEGKFGALAAQHHALLLSGKGAFVWGNTLDDVISRAVTLEYAAQLAITARAHNLKPQV